MCLLFSSIESGYRITYIKIADMRGLLYSQCFHQYSGKFHYPKLENRMDIGYTVNYMHRLIPLC